MHQVGNAFSQISFAPLTPKACVPASLIRSVSLVGPHGCQQEGCEHPPRATSRSMRTSLKSLFMNNLNVSPPPPWGGND